VGGEGVPPRTTGCRIFWNMALYKIIHDAALLDTAPQNNVMKIQRKNAHSS